MKIFPDFVYSFWVWWLFMSDWFISCILVERDICIIYVYTIICIVFEWGFYGWHRIGIGRWVKQLQFQYRRLLWSYHFSLRTLGMPLIQMIFYFSVLIYMIEYSATCPWLIGMSLLSHYPLANSMEFTHLSYQLDSGFMLNTLYELGQTPFYYCWI